MPKYKPMLISTNEEGYQISLKKAEEKCRLFHEALSWANQHVLIDDFKAFSDSFTDYFKEAYRLIHKNNIKLDIRVEKILDLMDVPIEELHKIEEKFKSNDSPIHIDENGVKPNINKRDFELYTSSSEENEKLRDARAFLDALKKLERHTKVYPINIQQATSQMIQYNIRNNTYSVNLRFR